VEGKGVIKDNKVQWWLRRFNQGDTSLEDQDRSCRPSLMNKEEFRAVVEQQPCTRIHRLSEELCHSQSTIVRHLHN